MMARYLGLSILLISGLSAQPAAATVNGGLVDLFAFSAANADAYSIYDDMDSFGTATNTPITASEHFSITDADPVSGAILAAAANSNNAYAILPDASHGTVEFDGNSTASVTSAGYDADHGASASAYGSDAFFYPFDISTAGVLTVTYTTAEDGLFSSVPVLQLITPSPTPVEYKYLAADGHGSASFDLTPGSYELEIFSDFPSQNAVRTGAVGDSQASADERYGFTINATVPEPKMWLIWLIGCGAIGVSIRGRLRRALRTA